MFAKSKLAKLLFVVYAFRFKALVPFSNTLNEAIIYAKNKKVEGSSDFLEIFSKKVEIQKNLFVYNFYENFDDIFNDDYDEYDEYVNGYTYSVTINIQRGEYCLPPIYKILERAGIYIGESEEIEDYLFSKMRKILYPYDIFLYKEEFNGIAYNELLLGAVVTAVHPAEEIVNVVNDFSNIINNESLYIERFPLEDRMAAAFEIGYMLLKFMPAIYKNFSEITLPRLFDALLLDGTYEAEKITTQLNQLKETFQTQKLLTDNIKKSLQTR